MEKQLLEAVNILLETINELPIETEEDYELVIEARQARAKINEVTRAVLSEGWDVNKDTNWIFPLDQDGMVPIPENVLDITASNANVIMRNWKLYDKLKHTHIFENEVPCDVLWLLDFNSLTHPIRHYITIRAARIFAARTIGDKEAIAFNQIDEDDAQLAARRSETRTGKYNMLGGAYGLSAKARLA